MSDELDDIAAERGKIIDAENAKIEADEQAGEVRLWHRMIPWAIALLFWAIVVWLISRKAFPK